MAPALLAQRPDGRALQRLEPDQHNLVGGEPSSREPADHAEQDHEAHVDDRDRRAVEVVDVLGDELPDLVDEEAKADAADHRRRGLRCRAEEGERGDHARGQQQAAPEHVRDVQRRAADLRISGRGEERPREEDGGDCADEERRQVLMQVVAATRADLQGMFTRFLTGP